jgi:carbon storage regulator
MLVLSRKLGEEVVICDNIRLTVLQVRGNRVRLGFAAPPGVSIRRAENCRNQSLEDESARSIGSGIQRP